MWKVPDIKNTEATEEIPELELQCRLDSESFGDNVKCTFFHPNEGNQLLTVVDKHYLIWDIATGGTTCQVINILR